MEKIPHIERKIECFFKFEVGQVLRFSPFLSSKFFKMTQVFGFKEAKLSLLRAALILCTLRLSWKSPYSGCHS